MDAWLDGEHMSTWYIGTMGFGYTPWQGTFYPEKMPKTQQLAYYASRFNALEMDSTFYGTPRAQTVERWAAQTPAAFRFCPKAPREITHDLRLAAAGEPLLTNFLDTMRLLGERLGPILFQFPPDFTVDERDSLAAFLPRLPRDLRFAVEVRHKSWWSEETADLLRAHAVCWAAADYIYLPREVRPTTDFLYVRFLGRHGQFATKTHEVLDKTEELVQWRAKIEAHEAEAPLVYAFFNDDYAGHAPATANRLRSLLGMPVEEGPPQQGRLF
jgi:uncharacterized protein YecE (DUF72 family)